jgi:hypothetical protein
MLQAAQAKGLTTAAVGKFGAAFIQDYHRGGIILDEDAAIPLSFAKELQNTGYAPPKNTVNDREPAHPLDRTGALSRRGFTYLTDVFVNYILTDETARPHDLLVEGARRNEPRVRPGDVQLDRRHEDER